jgi:hypothetical protein
MKYREFIPKRIEDEIASSDDPEKAAGVRPDFSGA